jgi:hypothetical protein
MSKLAWDILRILLITKAAYLADWDMADALGVSRTEFHTRIPGTVYDAALEELQRKGLIEELPDLACRYRLVVEEEA